jgi:hypothetical protein
MNYSVWGIIIAGIILFAPAISLITDLIIKKLGKLWNKNTK